MTNIPTQGTLALVGAGEYLPSMTAVDKFLLSRLSEPARVVCLPTAAGTEGDERIAYWSNLGVAHFTQLGATAQAVRVIDRASANDASLAAHVDAANFVYLSGGKPSYLHETLHATPVWDAIVNVLTRGGVVAGCSAGAMIFGARIPRFPPPPIWEPAFNFLPGVVVLPHFDEMSHVISNILHFVLGSGSTLVGIDGNTALIHADGAFFVSGTGGVTVWNNQQKIRHVAGETVELPASE